MDSRVTLALMAKARLVFEQPDTLLSFPVPPFALSSSEMRAAGGDLSDADDRSAPYTFSRIVNQRPSVPLWTSMADTMLWSVVDDILHRSGQVAQVEQNASREAAFRAAEQVLFAVDDQGLRTPTSRSRLYAQYRDTWFTVQQAYRARMVAAESSAADEELRTAWIRDEPALRAEIETAERDWRDLGFRDEIETAQAKIALLSREDPVLQWDRWSRNLSFHLDSQTDIASQAVFCPTTYSPDNVVDSSGWIDFHLSGAEFDQLIEDAPAELRTRLDPSGSGGAVSSVSFACTTVGVVRPWLDAGIFRAPFWRFADTGRFLSDGGSPPRGEWPAYVSGLVLARHVAVVAPTEPPPPPRPPDPPLDRRDRWRDSFGRGGRDTRDHRGRVATHTTREIQPVAPRVAIRAEPLFERRMLMAGERPVATPSPRAMMTLRAMQVHRLERPITTVTGFTPPVVASPPADDQVLILAFICRPLPKCPNPDPAMFRD